MKERIHLRVLTLSYSQAATGPRKSTRRPGSTLLRDAALMVPMFLLKSSTLLRDVLLVVLLGIVPGLLIKDLRGDLLTIS